MGGTSVSVLFGSAKKSGKATEANPTKAKPVMLPVPVEHVFKEPSHEERLHSAAADGHVSATRDYVAGHITKAQYEDRKRRAESVMAKTPKSRDARATPKPAKKATY